MNLRQQGFRSLILQRAEVALVSVPEPVLTGLVIYLEVLSHWNRKMNLSGFNLDSPSIDAVDRLIIEPLIAAQHVSRRPSLFLDVGSGGGSPALPLALVLAPERTLMIEAKSRKCTFLREAAAAIGLTGIDVVAARFEDRPMKGQFQLVSARAIRLETEDLHALSGALAADGQICWFRTESERGVLLPDDLEKYKTVPLGRPGCEAWFMTRSTWNKPAHLDISARRS